jgi:hypothetical protein
LRPDEALEFIQDLLSQFRSDSAPNPFTPFSPGAAQTIIQHISQKKALTPRRLMLYFDHVLREWTLDGTGNGEVQAEDAARYLAAPELGTLDTDASEP